MSSLNIFEDDRGGSNEDLKDFQRLQKEFNTKFSKLMNLISKGGFSNLLSSESGLKLLSENARE
jgi:hypothetical protein